jgi:hypothetical protein
VSTKNLIQGLGEIDVPTGGEQQRIAILRQRRLPCGKGAARAGLDSLATLGALARDPQTRPS